MKTIVTVNSLIPGVQNYCDYGSGESLQDYDIIFFNPEFPYYERFEFTDGDSAISKVAGKKVCASLNHWKNELTNALEEGKTIYFLLAQKEEDKYITGLSSSTGRKSTYSTTTLTNYDVLPFVLDMSNSIGFRFKVVDARFTDLFNTLGDYIRYEAYLNKKHTTPIATTYSGKEVGAIWKYKEYAGNLVILPYFNLNPLVEGNVEESKLALGLGTKLIKNLVALDQALTQQSLTTPQPEWVDTLKKSHTIDFIEKQILHINGEIEKKEKEKQQKGEELRAALQLNALLYETGKPLEVAIELFLKMLGYNVTNFRKGSLEIDHIMISPEGKRLIGEAEGKDKNAVGIEKFRQLESNINEDLQREETSEPALGVIFGNGYRFQEPSSRGIQFTEKCLLNAKRLSTVLIQTSDLFPIAMYIQDNPKDEEFKRECRKVIESASGSIAIFPQIPVKKDS